MFTLYQHVLVSMPFICTYALFWMPLECLVFFTICADDTETIRPNDTSVSVLPDVPPFLELPLLLSLLALACQLCRCLWWFWWRWCCYPCCCYYCCCCLPLLLLLLLAAAGAGGSGGGGGGAAAGGGNVLVQAEVGRNHADVEFCNFGGVFCNMKRPACK